MLSKRKANPRLAEARAQVVTQGLSTDADTGRLSTTRPPPSSNCYRNFVFVVLLERELRPAEEERRKRSEDLRRGRYK